MLVDTQNFSFTLFLTLSLLVQQKISVNNTLLIPTDDGILILDKHFHEPCVAEDLKRATSSHGRNVFNLASTENDANRDRIPYKNITKDGNMGKLNLKL